MLEQLQITGPMDDIVALQSGFLGSKSMDKRKALGQFFTGSVVAEYMASLVSKPKSNVVRILDAGAGTGILTASTALHCLDLGCKAVHAELYELDEDAVPSLKQALKVVQNTFKHQGGTFTFDVHCKDFVLSRPDKSEGHQGFDIAVINPPYFKYSAKDSPYAKAVSDLYRGDPNIYASFMAIVMACLNVGGQMIAITPRSFTNGLYFKGFRSYLLAESALSLVHIFRQRDKVFKNSDSAVLQENIICRFIKGEEQKSVSVRSSDCDASIHQAEEQFYPEDLIIDPSNDQQIIRIPESVLEAKILQRAEKFSTTFEGAGYFISTGRVVEHRTRDFITEDTGADNSVPLYRPHNVTPLTATWTGEHKKDVAFMLSESHEKHTMKNGTFVLLKRFSSKDEKRRLVSGVHLAEAHGCQLIGFGNKTNYIGLKAGALEKTEAYGLAAIFNSTFMDLYFRCVSGNTQVNATEIRVMKFPSRDQVEKVGEKIMETMPGSTAEIDAIVNKILSL